MRNPPRRSPPPESVNRNGADEVRLGGRRGGSALRTPRPSCSEFGAWYRKTSRNESWPPHRGYGRTFPAAQREFPDTAVKAPPSPTPQNRPSFLHSPPPLPLTQLHL